MYVRVEVHGMSVYRREGEKQSACLCFFFFLTNRPDAFEAFLEPHAYGLLGNLLFNGVLQLFPGQQLLQLERLSNVH